MRSANGWKNRNQNDETPQAKSNHGGQRGSKEFLMKQYPKNRAVSTNSAPQRSPKSTPDYVAIAGPWAAIGYTCIPASSSGKKPGVKGFKPYCGNGRRPPSSDELAAWSAVGRGQRNGLLLLASAEPGSGMPDLVAADCDDPAQRPPVEAVLGQTPLVVTTGRLGGGFHLVYRVRTGTTVRARNLRKSHGRAIDIKAGRGYVVAPGSVHETGRVYQVEGDIAITRKLIGSLPEVGPEDIDRIPLAPGWTPPPTPNGGGSSGARKRRSSGPVQHADPVSSIVPAPGPHSGMSIEQVVQSAGPGEHRMGCPHHDSDSGTCFVLHVEADGGTWGYCHGEGTTYVYQPSGEQMVSSTLGFDSLGGVPASGGPKEVTLDARHLTKDGHLRLRPGQREPRWSEGKTVLAIEAGKSRGKSYLAAAIAREALHRGERVVAAGPTRSLVRVLSSRFGLPCYLDLQGKIEGSAALCTPSMHRSPTWGQDGFPYGRPVEDGADLLILDEVEQQIRSLAGDHLSDFDARRGWRSLVAHVRAARRVILLDADLGPLTRMLLSLAGKLTECTWVIGPGDPERQWVRHPRRSHMLTDMRKAWRRGDRLALPCQSCTEAHALERLLYQWADERVMPPGKKPKIACVTLKTLGDYDLTKIDQWTAGLDAFIYSPVIGTGVSIDHRWFDVAYLFLAPRVGCALDALQQVWRVRNLISNAVHFWGRAGWPPGKNRTEPDQVLNRWIRREDESYRKLGVSRGIPDDMVAHDSAGRPVWNHDAMVYARAMAAVAAWEAKRGAGWCADALEAILRNRGEQVAVIGQDEAKDDEEKAVLAERQDARDQAEADDRAELLAAGDIPIEEARKRRDPRTRAEVLAIKKAYVRDFYFGEDDTTNLTDDILVWDDDGRGRAKARRVAHVQAMLGGHQNKVEALDRRELDEGISAPRLRHRTLEAGAIRAVLRKAGVCHHFSINPSPSPKKSWHAVADLAEMARWAEPLRAALGLLGLTVRKDVLGNPVQFLSNVLRRIGVQLECRRVRREGKVVREYCIDLESIERAREMSATYLERVLVGRAGLAEEEFEILRLAEHITPAQERELTKLAEVVLNAA